MSSLQKETNKRILVIDDEKEVLDFLKLFLEPQGWEVVLVSSPSEALQMLEKTPFFMVLTDIAMQEMDGYELISRIKEKGFPSQVALMTGFGYNPKHTLLKIYQSNRYPYLFKPFNRAKVSETVREAWKAYHADLLPEDKISAIDKDKVPPI